MKHCQFIDHPTPVAMGAIDGMLIPEMPFLRMTPAEDLLETPTMLLERYLRLKMDGKY